MPAFPYQNIHLLIHANIAIILNHNPVQVVDAGNALMRGLGTPGKAVVPANHVIGKVYLCYVEELVAIHL